MRHLFSFLLLCAALFGGCAHHVQIATPSGPVDCRYRNYAERLKCEQAFLPPPPVLVAAPGVQPALYVEPGGYPADFGVSRWEQFQQLAAGLQAEQFRSDQLARQNSSLAAELNSTEAELASVRGQLASAKRGYAAAQLNVDALRKSGTATADQLHAAETTAADWRNKYCELEAYSFELDAQNPNGAQLDPSQRLCKE